MKNLIILLLFLPFLIYSQNVSSYDELNIKGYMATVDVGFNNHGCRNLMMMESETHWNMLMDIDVLINKP